MEQIKAFFVSLKISLSKLDITSPNLRWLELATTLTDKLCNLICETTQELTNYHDQNKVKEAVKSSCIALITTIQNEDYQQASSRIQALHGITITIIPSDRQKMFDLIENKINEHAKPNQPYSKDFFEDLEKSIRQTINSSSPWLQVATTINNHLSSIQRFLENSQNAPIDFIKYIFIGELNLMRTYNDSELFAFKGGVIEVTKVTLPPPPRPRP